MPYQLGVDLGTTYSAAAVHRNDRASIIELGNRTATIPSVIFLKEDGTILTGEAANRRAVNEPDRVAREFKRRIGDPTPLLLGGSPYSAEALSARLLEWIIDRVSEREGDRPARVAVTHPANWGPYKLELFQEAIRLADLHDVVTLTEPEAAAIHYATLERMDPGTVVAVFDLGGGTFDAATLRKTESGFDFLGQPQGIERLGGIDFDQAVFGFVSRSLGGALQELDPNDPASLAAAARLRSECVEAKEALSGDTEVSIPVVLPNIQTDVRLTRAEFEQLIRPSLADTIATMHRAVASADLTMDDVDLVLLVGGSSRVPLIGQMVAGELGRPVAVDSHPKHSVALGAAWAAADAGGLGSNTEDVDATAAGAPGAAAAGAAAAGAAAAAMPSPEPTPPVDPVPSAQPAVSAEAAPMVGGTQPPPGSPPQPTGAGVGGPEAFPPPVGGPSEVAAQAPTVEQPAVGQPPPQQGGPTSGGGGAAVPMSVTGGGSGGGPNGNRALLIGAIAAVIVIGGLAAFFLTRDGDDTAADETETTIADSDDGTDSASESDDDGEVEESTTTSQETTTTTEATTTTTAYDCGGICAHIENVTVVDGELEIDWSAHGFQPDINNLHVHFYYDIYDTAQVGTNWSANGADQIGEWQLTDEQPFSTAGSSVAIANAPEGTTSICVTPTDSVHGVLNINEFECTEIPAELLGP